MKLARIEDGHVFEHRCCGEFNKRLMCIQIKEKQFQSKKMAVKAIEINQNQ